MNPISKLIFGAAITLPLFAQPVAAGTIDVVKNKVEAVKADTNLIKSKTSALTVKVNDQLQRFDELGSTVNSVIAETDIIKQALEPLQLVQQMKAKFAGSGFDPAEILEELDVDELSELVNKFKARRAEAKARMNDPDLETFRMEFLATLDGLAEIVSDTNIPEVSPLRGLVENAPAKVLSVVKMLTEDIFPELKQTVAAQVETVKKLRDLGLFEDSAFADPMTTSFAVADKNKVCKLGTKGAYYSTYLLVWKYQRGNSKIIERVKAFDVKVGGSALNTDQQIQIHGYIGVALNPGKELEERVKLVLNKLESRNKRAGYLKDAVKYTGMICDPLFASS